MSQPLQAAHVYLSFPYGGAEDLTAALSRLDSGTLQHRIICLGNLGSLGEKVASEKIRIEHHPWVTSRRWMPSAVWRLSRWLKQEKIQILHSHVYNAHLYAVPAAALAGIPVVVHHHKTFNDKKTHRLWIMRLMNRWISLHLTLSEKTRDDLVRRLSIAEEKIHVLANPVDRVAFSPAPDPEKRREIREKLGLPAHAWLIGHVGAFRPEKNHERLLKAAEALHERHKHIHWVLLGEGQAWKTFSMKVQDRGLSEVIQLPGAQRPVGEWIRSLDCFVFPSTWEGLPLALLQALCCRIPILASRIEGNIAALGSAHPGLFDLEESDSLEKKVERLAGDPEWARSILDYQEGLLPAIPSLEDYNRSLENLYSRCLSGI